MRTTIELRKEVIAKCENGVRVSNLDAQYDMARSTISTFLKNKEAIKAVDVAKRVTIISSTQKTQIMDEDDNLLLIWIKEKELYGDSISKRIICEKALHSSANSKYEC